MCKKTVSKILFMSVASIAITATSYAESAAGSAGPVHNSRPVTTVVIPFTVQSASGAEGSSLSAQACPPQGAATELSVDARVIDAISAELREQLSKRMPVLMNPDQDQIPAGSLVIAGCIVKAEAGSAAGRMIGMNVGASRLGARVIVLSNLDGDLRTVDSFDIEVKGGSALPPLGPAGLVAHAAMQPHQTLSADAKKLADRIAKKLKEETKHVSR